MVKDGHSVGGGIKAGERGGWCSDGVVHMRNKSVSVAVRRIIAMVLVPPLSFPLPSGVFITCT
jgi:hypothetical protein